MPSSSARVSPRRCEEFSPWMKVLLYDDLFYYTIVIVMHSDMQELMWAAECKHHVTRLDLIQPV